MTARCAIISTAGDILVRLYRRHTPECRAKRGPKPADYKRCDCLIYGTGKAFDRKKGAWEDIKRQTTHERDWEKAEAVKRAWEDGASESTVTVSDAVDKWVEDAERRKLADRTQKLYSVIGDKMKAAWKGTLGTVSPQMVREMLNPKHNAQTQLNHLQFIRGFFHFCQGNEWLTKNPAAKVATPNVDRESTPPFTVEEMVSILATAKRRTEYGLEQPAKRWRSIRAYPLVLLMRYSGLRLSDATCLARSSIIEGRVVLRAQKNKELVTLPLPTFVLDALAAIPFEGPYYFWSERKCGRYSNSRNWGAWLTEQIFTPAGIIDGHPHRLRHTFSVEALKAGVPLHRVSKLLGHTKVETTQKYYARWVPELQALADEDMRRMWQRDPVVFGETKEKGRTQ